VNNSHEPWVILESKRVFFEPPIFAIDKQRCRRSQSNKEGDFYIIHCPEWVQVVALTRDGSIVLVRQFRFGSRQFSIETPGGVVEKDEDILTAARRELLEETGYAPERARIISSLRPNSALQDNSLHIVFAEHCVESSKQDLDPYEEIDVILLKPNEVYARIASGAIDHALATVALLLAKPLIEKYI
jgi:8-oxo-dGTP pyrophosphatase MutT (NUDIX family)